MPLRPQPWPAGGAQLSAQAAGCEGSRDDAGCCSRSEADSLRVACVRHAAWHRVWQARAARHWLVQEHSSAVPEPVSSADQLCSVPVHCASAAPHKRLQADRSSDDIACVPSQGTQQGRAGPPMGLVGARWQRCACRAGCARARPGRPAWPAACRWSGSVRHSASSSGGRMCTGQSLGAHARASSLPTSPKVQPAQASQAGAAPNQIWEAGHGLRGTAADGSTRLLRTHAWASVHRRARQA